MPRGPYRVAEVALRFVERARTIRLPSGAVAPRRLLTIVRYPARARGAGPFPLVVFGHGFAVTPAPYAPLLESWTRAGYVVAAPVFPLGNANAPGGPNESDLVNQPGDMSFVITRLESLSARHEGALGGMIDPREVAVSGQSDGGDTALAAAYDPRFLDRRIRAAVILSGAEIPGIGGFSFPRPSPPLLAIQGTADPINPPELTYTFYDRASPPKYLLTMFGASHLGPYTDQQPQLRIVERVTIEFLDRYLKHRRIAAKRMTLAGSVSGVSSLRSQP